MPGVTADVHTPAQPPAPVGRWAADGAAEAVWRNELGGVTYRLGAPGRGERYIKVEDVGPEWEPAAVAARLRWVRRFVAAPAPVAFGGEPGGDGPRAWLVTEAVGGESAVAPRHRRRPGVTVPALGRALRAFHDVVPARGCPFSWSVADRVARMGLDPALGEGAPPVDAVVCHGDACSPNFLLDDAGRPCGYVDLGALGVADRWGDLAPALMSLEWNYGPGWERVFLDAYGCDDDPARRAFYGRLWNAEPAGRTP